MRVASLLVAVLVAAAFPAVASATLRAPRARARAAGSSSREAGELAREDRGLYVAFCPRHQEAARQASLSLSPIPFPFPLGGGEAEAGPRASAAEANHDGWPADECLKMDKGQPGVAHTLVGLNHVHNWLLGGYGNDTLYAGEEGDVMWGDYHPEGQSEDQRDYIHGGRGDDWIYSSHGFNEIWTGAGDDHLALVYGHGVVFCDGPGVKTFVMRYLPQNRPWTLVGCSHKVLVRYRA
jgi:hypothetical protein